MRATPPQRHALARLSCLNEQSSESVDSEELGRRRAVDPLVHKYPPLEVRQPGRVFKQGFGLPLALRKEACRWQACHVDGGGNIRVLVLAEAGQPLPHR